MSSISGEHSGEAEVPREAFFSDAEYGRRLAAVRAEMDRRGVRTLITPHPSNITYLAGHFSVNIWDLMFLVVPAEGQPLLLAWQFERGRFLASGVIAELVTWQSGTEPVAFLAETLKTRGLAGGFHVDISSPYTTYAVIERIIAALDARKAENLIETVRLKKSAEEIAWLERASAITDSAIVAASRQIAPGARDYDIAGAAVSALTRGGSEFFCIDPIVCIGWRSGTPHSNRGGTVAADGDPVFLEMGATLARYTCPIMRTRIVGKPSGELEELAAYSSDCIAAMIATMRPGVRACDVGEAGRKVLAPILDRVTFHHVYGYSLGIAYPPTWIENGFFFLMPDNPAPLETGMVFHLPLTLRSLGRFGAGFSEAVEITPTGARVFSRIPRSLAG